MELRDYLTECTLPLETARGRGVGLAISPHLVLTAAHLVEDAAGGCLTESPIHVVTGATRSPARLHRYAASPDPDLAVLYLDQPLSACAYLYAPCRSGDPLYVSGPRGDSRAVELSLAGAANGNLLLDTPVPRELEGAAVLDLRTGGVAGIVIGSASGTSVNLLGRLFPDVVEAHDRHHAGRPDWFGATGVRGTVFAARELIHATRDTCETPIQPLITPANRRSPVDLLAPVGFLPVGASPSVARTAAGGGIGEILDRSWAAGRGVLLTGPTGSGRSSVLRALGYRQATAFGNLGASREAALYPLLLRASQLTVDDREVEETLIDAIGKGSESMAGMDLPPGFLSDLAASPGVRLLLMIDGMDEIQNSRDIAEFVGLVGRIQEAPGFGPRTQLLLTSRPSSAEHFRYASFDICEIRPLSDESVRTAARQWLGGGAEAFLAENEPLVSSGLLSSPLVLAVALKLYETRPQTLPTRVVELYGMLISRLASERRDELEGKYGPEVADNAVDLLGFVALELLRSGGVMDESWVRSTAARYFRQFHGMADDRAMVHAESFTHFAAADSHFIGPAGSRFFWSHLSFRDYFAAAALNGASPDPAGVVDEIRRRWFDSNWGRAPSFALQLLEEEATRIDLVREVLASGRTARFRFVADLLREGAGLPADLLGNFVGDLRAQAEREKGDAGVEAVATDLLLVLGQIPATRGLVGEPFAV